MSSYMQICMKPKPEKIERLGAAMRARRGKLGMTVVEVARSSGVHASQVSRILRGQFSTISHSVVRICTVLGIDPDTAAEAERLAASEPDRAARRLQQRLLAAWDRTPADADRLSSFLVQLAELRRTASGKR
jgi:transcriptional regulator with XRE-family HTH domain